jgi:hypothetical protein
LIVYFTGEGWSYPSPNQVKNVNTGSQSNHSSLIENMSSKLNIILIYLLHRFISGRVHGDAMVIGYDPSSLQGSYSDSQPGDANGEHGIVSCR